MLTRRTTEFGDSTTLVVVRQCVINLYYLMDAAYCSSELREHRKSLGHVRLIDHNPHCGEMIEFDPAEAIRYNESTVAERTNARLKDEFAEKNYASRAQPKSSSPTSVSWSLPPLQHPSPSTCFGWLTFIANQEVFLKSLLEALNARYENAALRKIPIPTCS